MKVRFFAVLCLLVVVALVLSGGVRPTAAQPPSPDEVSLTEKDHGRQIDLDEKHLLVLNLESNPSTGYGWQVSGINPKVIRQLGDVEFKSDLDGVGTPGVQILRFESVSAGQAALDLVYRRPWEKSVGPLKTFSVQVRTKGAYAGVRPAPASADKDSTVYASPPLQALPSAYNWCNLNGCTPVRDQGNCGSCWAFSTVGALESAIKIQTGTSKDLSEQYLVSCNAEGWGCNGGWFAHDYHQWKYITGEPGPGAVYESNFPYKAADVACNPPHVHNEKISSWAYVGGKNSVPSVSAIKQAIYDHGPVSAAIYVGSDFQRYSGGVFSSSQKGKVNHAIVLVGWDDSQGYWILRNSWGSRWGESGYMRIKYGTSNVGTGANYVVFP